MKLLKSLSICNICIGFRARKGAAPLKRTVMSLPLTSTPSFRARKGAAPLKQTCRI